MNTLPKLTNRSYRVLIFILVCFAGSQSKMMENESVPKRYKFPNFRTVATGGRFTWIRLEYKGGVHFLYLERNIQHYLIWWSWRWYHSIWCYKLRRMGHFRNCFSLVLRHWLLKSPPIEFIEDFPRCESCKVPSRRPLSWRRRRDLIREIILMPMMINVG